MPAYKNKDNGSWYVVTQYTDWTGERKPKCKRGFATRREALEWEQKFQQQSAGDLDMSFEAYGIIKQKSFLENFSRFFRNIVRFRYHFLSYRVKGPLEHRKEVLPWKIVKS